MPTGHGRVPGALVLERTPSTSPYGPRLPDLAPPFADSWPIPGAVGIYPDRDRARKARRDTPPKLRPQGGIPIADGSMPTTRVTLVGRLRQDPADQAAWDLFVERYGRHIYRWCRQWKLQDADAEDVTQDILVKLARKLRAFTYDPSRSFRGWLKTLAHHAWRDFADSPRRAQTAAGDGQAWQLLQSLEAREDLVQKLEE